MTWTLEEKILCCSWSKLNFIGLGDATGNVTHEWWFERFYQRRQSAVHAELLEPDSPPKITQSLEL